MSYQPTWRQGAVVAAGERDCADRYQPIRDLLATIDGPFTVLDLGAHSGYFTSRIAWDFPNVQVTAVDPRPQVRQAAAERVTVMQQTLDAAGLRALPRHDVVLALSVLHHLPDWRQALPWLRACRRWLVTEVPHPGERWMRSAAARRELAPLHNTVAGQAGRKLGEFPRTGRDGSRHMRPMHLTPGTLTTLTGVVFAGSGTCSRKLRPELHARGLDRQLGYQPYPGSLNLRCPAPVNLGTPAVNWPGTVGGRKRPYWFWPAWAGDMPLHAMLPASRGHGPNHVELVAPTRLRDTLVLTDGDQVTVEVCTSS